MYVYNKRCHIHTHYAGGGIFDSIASVVGKIAENEVVRKAASETGNRVIQITAKKVGDTAGEKIVSGIDKLVNKKSLV